MTAARPVSRLAALAAAAAAAVALAGCLDSIVGGECRAGWELVEGACRPALDLVDGGADVTTDAPAAPVVDAPSCAAGSTWCGGLACVDLSSDPEQCGACGVACASGICSDGVCQGALPGHVVLIGHDYRAANAAARRLLANAASLGGGASIRVAVFAGDTDLGEAAVATQALSAGLAASSHLAQIVSVASPPVSRVAHDVLLVLPQRMSSASATALGQRWQPALDAFLAAGGVVVGLDGPGTATVDVLRGAGLVAATAGASVSGQPLDVVAPADALAVGVPTPYLGATGTTTFALGAGDHAVVAAPGGAGVAIHRVAGWP